MVKGQKMHKLADVLAQPDDMALFRRLITAWRDPAALVPGAVETPTVAWDDTARDDVPAFIEEGHKLFRAPPPFAVTICQRATKSSARQPAEPPTG